MRADSDRFVVLRGGLTTPVDPLLLIFELEDRGFALSADGEALLVRPASHLTPTDCERIRIWKFHLLSLLAYEAPEVA